MKYRIGGKSENRREASKVKAGKGGREEGRERGRKRGGREGKRTSLEVSNGQRLPSPALPLILKKNFWVILGGSRQAAPIRDEVL